MAADQVPQLFFVLFAATFVTNGVYVLCMFLLRRQLGGPATFGVGDTLSLLRFVYGERQAASGTAVRLAGVLRVLAPLALVMTLGVFAYFAAISAGIVR